MKFPPDFPPQKPPKFNYSSKQIYGICKAQITSVDFTCALKAREAVFSAPLVPRKPNYNSDTVCNEGQEWRMANPLKIRKEATCCFGRGRASSPKGCRPHNQPLNLDPWIHIFLIFHVTKWEVHIKYFCCILKYDGGCLEEKHLCDWRVSSSSHFFHGTLFTWKSNWQANCSYSHLGI